MITDNEKQVVQKCLETISEHFDCVQLLVSREIGDFSGTERIFIGRGNWFARKGMAKDFLDMDNQIESAREIANHLKNG